MSAQPDDIRRLMQHAGGSVDAYREFNNVDHAGQASRWALLRALAEVGQGSATVPRPDPATLQAYPQPTAPTPVADAWIPLPVATPVPARPAPVTPLAVAPDACATPPQAAPLTRAPAAPAPASAVPAPFAVSPLQPAPAVTPTAPNPFGKLFRTAATAETTAPQPDSLKSLLKNLGKCL